jgi:cytochrome P450
MIPRYVDPILRPVAEQLVDEIATFGEVDLMTTFAKKYPLRIITRLLGLPVDDEDIMTGWVKGMFSMYRDPEGAKRANAEFTDYVAPLIDARRARPGEDLLSAIVNEEIDGQRLEDEEIFGFLRLLFPAGVDTTWLTLGSVMYAVLQHPEVHQLLLDDEEERLWAVEETLRWEPTVATDEHTVIKDVVVEGTEIPAGEEVRLAVASANRDPDVFADPDRWDLARRPRNHLSFGLGRHFSLGAHLARAELQVAIEVLLRRLPNLRLTDDPWISGSGLRGPKILRVAWNAV